MLSHVWLFLTPQTIACQAPLSIDFPGKNTEVDCHFLLQGIFPTQWLNPWLLHRGQVVYHWATWEASWSIAAAAAKSLQSCLALCDPIHSSPPGSPIPEILQARTLEWVAISFSTAWKWKVNVKSFSRVQLLETPWTTAYQAPPSMGFSRQEYWSGVLGALQGLNESSPSASIGWLKQLHLECA